MTEETKAVEKVEPVATEEAGNASSNGKKKYDRPPVEELFDLSKPIKRVSQFQIQKAGKVFSFFLHYEPNQSYPMHIPSYSYQLAFFSTSNVLKMELHP